jgi:hypothetical protein
MANGKAVYLSGKAKYVRLDTLDKFGKYSFLLYLDETSKAEWAKLKASGVKNGSKIDDEGEFVRLSRPPKKEFRGVETLLPMPEIVDSEGKPWVRDTWIGNGSDVTAKLVHYTFKDKFSGVPGAAIRLEGIKVHNLVPYQPTDRTPEEQKRVEGLDTAQQPW